MAALHYFSHVGRLYPFVPFDERQKTGFLLLLMLWVCGETETHTQKQALVSQSKTSSFIHSIDRGTKHPQSYIVFSMMSCSAASLGCRSHSNKLIIDLFLLFLLYKGVLFFYIASSDLLCLQYKVVQLLLQDGFSAEHSDNILLECLHPYVQLHWGDQV